jgi:hypothetical protein
LGFFGNRRHPRVLWMGLQGDVLRMGHFRDALQKKLKPFGIKTEKRPFKPHLTLGRFKKGAHPWPHLDQHDIGIFGDLKGQTCSLEELVLFKSDLKPAGPFTPNWMPGTLGELTVYRCAVVRRRRKLQISFCTLTTAHCKLLPRAKEVRQMDRERAVDQAISQIEKQFGRGSIMKLGEDKKIDVPAISTGSLSLDLALGVGGVPRGRVVEIYGPESSGKTTLALHIAAEAQAKGGMVAFVDAEHALDVVYARKLGVDVDNLLVSQPDTGEQALDIAEILVRSGAIDVLIVDSVAALVPRAEIEGEMGDHHVGLQARLMSQALESSPEPSVNPEPAWFSSTRSE